MKRLRWNDDDWLISTTTSYGVFLWAVVVAIVVIPSAVARALSSALGIDRFLAEIAVALVAAAVFVPANRRIRRRVERLFFKERVALRRGFAALLQQLSSCGTPAALAAGAGEGLERLLHPEACVVYTRVGSEYVPLFSSAPAVSPSIGADSRLVALLTDHVTPLDRERWNVRLEGMPNPFGEPALQSIGAAVVVPIRQRDIVAGFICLGRKRSGDTYTSNDLALLSAVGDKAFGVLGLVAGSPASEASAATFPDDARRGAEAYGSSSNDCVFRKQGDYWRLDCDGASVRLKDMRGLHYLAVLLRHPGHELHVLDVMMQVNGNGSETPQFGSTAARGELPLQHSGRQPLLDAKAKADYKCRLEDLRASFAEAQRNNDLGRATDTQAEIEAITAQLAAAVGLGGRNRPTGSDAERARLAVTKGIKTAVEKIRASEPSLAHHLATSIKTGYFCSYTPDPARPVTWML